MKGAITTAEALTQGRAAFARHAWGQAYARLSEADHQGRLEPEDFEHLAVTAHLVGRDAESETMWARAHAAMAERGDVARAAHCAFWLGFGLLRRGEATRGRGWLARAERLVADLAACAEQGYVLLPTAWERLDGGEPAAADELFDRAGSLAQRVGDADLATLARLGQGQARVRLGETEAGVALLDDAMRSTTAGAVSPMVVGLVCCGAIEAARDAFDLQRAQQWTTHLDRWCAAQPDLVPYRGQCLVYRAELLQLHGEWPAAMDEAERAGVRLSHPAGQPGVAMAFYRQGELRRLRGELAEAEAAYQRATEAGCDPQPGLALLRLAQGDVDTAAAMIRRALDETSDPAGRARRQAARVDIAVAAGDAEALAVDADELSALAEAVDRRWPRAIAGYATGAARLVAGEPGAALTALREAEATWHELEIPYEAARTRVLIARACRDAGDAETAADELDSARRTFEALGATADVARVDALTAAAGPRSPGGLTRRELEVLRLVASGLTNRQVAAELVLSEHTVRRHLQNVFSKLGVSSRAAATAYAVRHGLV